MLQGLGLGPLVRSSRGSRHNSCCPETRAPRAGQLAAAGPSSSSGPGGAGTASRPGEGLCGRDARRASGASLAALLCRESVPAGQKKAKEKTKPCSGVGLNSFKKYPKIIMDNKELEVQKVAARDAAQHRSAQNPEPGSRLQTQPAQIQAQGGRNRRPRQIAPANKLLAGRGDVLEQNESSRLG